MRFPKKLRHNGKGRVLATIYRKAGCYRVYWRVRVDGKPRSRFADFSTYSEAKKKADSVVADLHKGAQTALLSPGQASDAIAAFQRLERFYEETGIRIPLSAAVSDYCDNRVKLNGRTLGEATDGFLATAVHLKQKAVSDAVEEFISAEEMRTRASHGKRPQLSPKYAYNRGIMLRRFACFLPGHRVGDLAKEHLDTFIGCLAGLKTKSKNHRKVLSGKGRNHHRAAIKQFLSWCVRKDYLSRTHRLCEADSMRPEHVNDGEIQFYTASEFAALLDAAEGPMRAMVAIGGLAGLRTSELLRLTWQDVWRVENHIEITAQKAKTRQRRLVEIVPALAHWLELYRSFQEGRLCELHEITWQQHFVDLCEKARVDIKGQKTPVLRKANGLRHAFCTYHFALHANENLTAQQAGNSPAMVHGHYKGLATKMEAEAFFAVTPHQPSNVVALPSIQNPT